MKILSWLRPLGLQDFLVIAGTLSILMVQMPGFANDPGLGWHLKTGEFILNGGGVPTADPFLGGVFNRPWIADQWLADVLLEFLNRLGSWPLLYGVLAVAYLFIYFIVLHRGVYKITGAALASSFAVLMAFKIGQVHFILRPVMLSFLFFAYIFVELCRLYDSIVGVEAEARSALRLTKRLCLIFPILFALWANIHPAFVLGLGIVGFFPCALWVDEAIVRKERATIESGLLKWIALLVSLSIGATFINPYGAALHNTVIFLSQSDFAMQYYQEWHAPDFKSFEGQIFQLTLGVIVVALYIARTPEKLFRFFELGTLILFSIFSLTSVRMLPFFGIIASVPLARALTLIGTATFWERWRKTRLLHRAFSRLEEREARTRHGYLAFGLLSLLIVGTVFWKGKIPLFKGAYGPSQKLYPFDALTYLQTQGKEDLVVLNEMDWGGFMTLYGYPKIRGVIDDRTSLLRDEFYKQHFEKLQVGKDINGYLTSLDAKYLLLRADSPVTQGLKLDRSLSLVYEDPVAALFQRHS